MSRYHFPSTYNIEYILTALVRCSIFLPTLLFPVILLGQTNLHQLDGQISQNEIAEMEMIGNTDIAEFYLSKIDNLLKLSIKSESLYVASVCIADNNAIKVYHSSAALGDIEYTKSDANWTTNEEFNWEMREAEMTSEIILKRQDFMSNHNWIATTSGMGTSGETEFYFNSKIFNSERVYLAVGLMLASDPETISSFPTQGANSCSDHDLVAGSPKAQYPFDYSRWAEIAL